MTFAFGVVMMSAGVFIALAVEGVPAGVIAGAAFGCLTLSLAAGRVSARAGVRARLPLPRGGWLRIASGAAVAFALMSVLLATAGTRGLAWSAAYGAGAVLLGGWCLLALRPWPALAEDLRHPAVAMTEARAVRDEWKEHDKAILRGDLTLAAWQRAGQASRGERR